MRPRTLKNQQNRQNWAKIFENAELCAERIENATYCYRGEYDEEIYERAEKFKEAIHKSLWALRSRKAKDEDWKVIKAAAQMYENLKHTLPAADATDDDEYDRQIETRLYIIAQRAAAFA